MSLFLRMYFLCVIREKNALHSLTHIIVLQLWHTFQCELYSSVGLLISTSFPEFGTISIIPNPKTKRKWFNLIYYFVRDLSHVYNDIVNSVHY